MTRAFATALRQLVPRSCAPSGSGVPGPRQPAVEVRAARTAGVSRGPWAPAIAALVTSAVVRLVWRSFSEPGIVHDERAYLLQAAIFARGHWTVRPHPFQRSSNRCTCSSSPRLREISAGSRPDACAWHLGGAPGTDAGASRRNCRRPRSSGSPVACRMSGPRC